MSCRKCIGSAGYCEGCMSQGTIPVAIPAIGGAGIATGDLIHVGPGLERHPIQAYVLSYSATLVEVGWLRVVAGELTFVRGITSRDGISVLSFHHLGPEQQKQFSRKYGRGI